MNANELQGMLNELLIAIQEVLQSGEELSDEVQGAIADTIALMMERIEVLRSEEASNAPKSLVALPSQGPSSNVAGMKYNPKSQKMLVQYLGPYPNKQGPIYEYDNTPPIIAEMLQSGIIPARTDGKNKWGKWWKGKSPSLGASAYTLLKERGVPYQRIA